MWQVDRECKTLYLSRTGFSIADNSYLRDYIPVVRTEVQPRQVAELRDPIGESQNNLIGSYNDINAINVYQKQQFANLPSMVPPQMSYQQPVHITQIGQERYNLPQRLPLFTTNQ